MRSKISSGSNGSSLWTQMGNIIAQYDGMYCLLYIHSLTDQFISDHPESQEQDIKII